MNSIKHKTAKKITSVLLSASTMVWLAGASAFMPVVASADAATDALIAQLQAQIAALTMQLSALAGSQQSSQSVACVFTRDLTINAQGPDVTCLQNYLTSTGHFKFSGGATGFFGNITRTAVAQWQSANGVAPAVGYFGAISRAKYNSMSNTMPPAPLPTGTPGVPGGPVGSGVSVTSGSQPANSLAPQSAARVPFTRVVLTASADGDVTVNGITVERTGLAQDAVFSGVVLLDESGAQVGLEKTFNSNHQATIGDTFVIPRGTSKSFTVAGNMAASLSSYAGQVAYLTVKAVNSVSSVNGALPITGAGHTINASLTIGTVTMSVGPLDPLAAQSKKVGDTAIIFSSIKVTAGSAERVILRSIRWNQSGSAATADLTNVKSYVDGVAYDVMVSADGKYFTTNLGGKILEKGGSVEIYIKGDLASGSGRTVDFDLYRRIDLAVDGETYGYGILPPNGSDTSGTDDSAFHQSTNPWFDGSEVSIGAGTIKVSKATSVAAQNVPENVSNQPLGGFEVEVKGEPITVASLLFHFGLGGGAGGTATYDDLTGITLVKADGTTVAGPVDAALEGTSGQKVTFTDTITFPVGVTTYTLKGKLGSDFANDHTIIASTTPDVDWTTVTGQTTGNSITPSPTSSVSANTMTVKSGALAISVSGSPTAQTVVAGAQGFVFANYLLDASASGEDVRLVALPVEFTAWAEASNLTGCKLWDGASAVSTSKDPTASASSTSFTMTGTGLTIPKGVVKTLALSCNIAGSTSNNTRYQWGYDSTGSDPAPIGTVSGQSIAETETDSSGQIMTISSGGTFTVTKDSSSPSYAVAAGGSSNVTLGMLKFTSTNEALTLKKVGLQMSNSSASSSPTDLVKVTLWDGATNLGEAVFVSRTATLTLSSDVVIPKDGSKVLTIKGDLAAIGSSLAGTEGALIQVDYDGTTLANTQVTGASSGATVNSSSSSDTAMDGVRMFRSYPTVAKLSVPSNTLQNGTISLLRFSVSANSAGDIGLYKFTVKIATTTATLTTVNIYGYTDSSFSTAVGGVNAGGKLLATDLNCATTADCGAGINFVIDNAGTATQLQVPAGSTRYFDVQGTVAGTASGAVVSTQLEGDAAYPSLAVLMGTTTSIDADTNDDFIWSPNATTSGVMTQNDFTNGYGVAGLPGTNLSAETISK